MTNCVTTLDFPNDPVLFSSNWKNLALKIKTSDQSKNKELRKTGAVSFVADSQSQQCRKVKEVTKQTAEKSKGLIDSVPSTSGNRLVSKTLQKPTQLIDYEKEPNETDGLTKCVALDCEFVGIGEMGKDNMLARVSIVNQEGSCLYDKFVKPREPVTDYRTKVSGVRSSDLIGGEDFTIVQKEVCAILDKRILVGHAVGHDLQVLFLSHPRKKIRDTSSYRPFKAACHSSKPSLKKLAKAVLGIDIQEGEHNSVVDARTCMQLYNLHKKEWEKSLKSNRVVKGKKAKLDLGSNN